MKMTIGDKLQIGESLYRYVEMSGIWTYTVIGIRAYKDSELYEIRSESCSHGWKCELLIAHDDKGNLIYVSMLNNDEDDDQSYWHSDATIKSYFYKTKSDAQRAQYALILKLQMDKLKEAKAKVVALEQSIKETHVQIASFSGTCI